MSRAAKLIDEHMPDRDGDVGAEEGRYGAVTVPPTRRNDRDAD